MPSGVAEKVGDCIGSRVIVGMEGRDRGGYRMVQWKCDCGAEGSSGLKAFRKTLNCPSCRPGNLPHPIIHGHAGRVGRSRLYDCWANMMQRVRGTGSERNKRWYAGINVCREWEKFEGFRDWALACGYEPGLSLDRLNPLGNYEPSNCEWVTRNENSRRALAEMRRLAAIGRQVELQRQLKG